MDNERMLLTSLRATLLCALIVFGGDNRFRPSFIQALGSIEDALGIPRTCPPRAERRAGRTVEAS